MATDLQAEDGPSSFTCSPGVCGQRRQYLTQGNTLTHDTVWTESPVQDAVRSSHGPGPGPSRDSWCDVSSGEGVGVGTEVCKQQFPQRLAPTSVTQSSALIFVLTQVSPEKDNFLFFLLLPYLPHHEPCIYESHPATQREAPVETPHPRSPPRADLQ